MKVRLSFNKLFLLAGFSVFALSLKAQFLVDMIDTSHSEDRGLYAIFKKSDHLQISGYFQPQFQVAQSKGALNYSGGDFSKYSNSRFMLRRGRIRFDYSHFNSQGLPRAQVVFQFDGTERGVVIRDFWGRFFENRFQLFAFTTGMFARPFGYELNLSSSDREGPERGRMSQILMKTERDLGLMATFEPRKKNNPLRLIKIDIGIFNGEGLSGPEEYDSYKDVISRISLKPYPVSGKVMFSAGASFFEGGIVQNSKYLYKMGREAGGGKTFHVDSSENNIGAKDPRKYRGFDAQLKILNKWGKTELRAEYWWGTQTSSANQSATPGILLNEPYYIREFNGAFFYLLQNIVNEKHQVILKYDIYDPNTDIKEPGIGAAASNTHSADVRFNTIGIGYQYFFDTHIKLVLWYDIVRNENTSLDGYKTDVKDNILTCRLQYKF